MSVYCPYGRLAARAGRGRPMRSRYRATTAWAMPRSRHGVASESCFAPKRLRPRFAPAYPWPMRLVADAKPQRMMAHYGDAAVQGFQCFAALDGAGPRCAPPPGAGRCPCSRWLMQVHVRFGEGFVFGRGGKLCGLDACVSPAESLDAAPPHSVPQALGAGCVAVDGGERTACPLRVARGADAASGDSRRPRARELAAVWPPVPRPCPVRSGTCRHDRALRRGHSPPRGAPSRPDPSPPSHTPCR